MSNLINSMLINRRSWTSKLPVCLFLLVAACTQSQNKVDPLVTSNAATTSGVNLVNIDESARPQDDFYQYVSGKWIEETILEDDELEVGAFATLGKNIRRDIRSLIEGLNVDNVSSVEERKIAEIYQSFMDVASIEAKGVDPIKPLLAAIDAIKTKDELVVFMGRHQFLELDLPIGIFVSPDAVDSTQYALYLEQGGLGLPDRDYYLVKSDRYDEILKTYPSHMATMLDLADIGEAQEKAQAILQLEVRLAKAQWSRAESRDSTKTYNKMKVADLSDFGVGFSWPSFLSAANLEDQNSVIVSQPSYFREFTNIFNETSLATWKGYLEIHAIKSFAPFLDQRFNEQYFAFHRGLIGGVEAQEPRWKRAITFTERSMGQAVGKLYVERLFDVKVKAKTEEIIYQLTKAYEESIHELDWMSGTTKQAALRKLSSMQFHVAYPTRWKNYSALQTSNSSLGQILTKVRTFDNEYELAKLGEPVRDWEWYLSPHQVNGFYSRSENRFALTAALLQPPYIDIEAEDAVNYGAIGAFIGHEIAHAFDDQGSKYDEHGNLKDWWTPQDREKFTERTDNLIEQYNGYQIFDDLNVNGELTIGENIADLSGLSIAYSAYINSLDGREAPVIDGLTGDQRFFMGWTQIWTTKLREEYKRYLAAIDSHAPEEQRVIGPLSNIDEFYQAFGVQPGDKMYIPPEQRVRVW